MKKVLWLDVDGVLLDYTSAFLKYAESHLTYETLLDYDLTKLFATPDDCWKKMREFTMSVEFANLPAIAQYGHIHGLKNAGYELRIITQLTAPSVARKNRIANLTYIFGSPFSEVVFTEHGSCKLEYLAGRKDGEPDAEYILVEDNPRLLDKADEHGHLFPVEVLAISHPYNKDVIEQLELKTYSSFVGVYHELLDRVV
jgi:hypothetical protein